MDEWQKNKERERKELYKAIRNIGNIPHIMEVVGDIMAREMCEKRCKYFFEFSESQNQEEDAPLPKPCRDCPIMKIV